MRVLILFLMLLLTACQTAPTPTAAPAIGLAPSAAMVPTATSASPAVTPTATAVPPTATAIPPTVAPPSPTSLGWPRTLTDGLGRSVTLLAPPARIISYLPSNTETLFAIGAGDRIVGVDNFSDVPAAAKDLPKVGDLKPNLEVITALRPDLVIMMGRSPDLVTLLEPLRVPVLVLEYKDLSGTLDNFTLLGRATGTEREASALAERVRGRIESVRLRTANVTRPRVYYEVDGSDPARPYTVGPGSYIDEMVRIAGGINVMSDAPSAFPQVSLEAIVAKAPQIIVVGFASGDAAQAFRARPGWAAVAAVQRGDVRVIDGVRLSRPGPRVAEALEQLADVLHGPGKA